jgi:3D (Asp-Asp-Asp) domain-containing protein
MQDIALPQDEAATPSAPITRGRTLPSVPDSSAVENMIAALTNDRHAPPNRTEQRNQALKQAEKQTEKQTRNKNEKQVTPAPGPDSAAGAGATGSNTDPSYVFFREIPDSEGGPIGAMGVQLTAGRSIAVDPRTTPLGSPVFVSTIYPGKKTTLNRLMLAQDTGGAIRGAVRADYFWGFGNDAYTLAARMKENGKMWLFFPKKQDIPAYSSAISLRGPSSEQQLAECVVPDPELCVE